MKRWILCFTIFALTGCGAAHKNIPVISKSNTSPAINLADTAHVKAKLDSQYAEWKGTRYKMGGTGKRGVDCSGFVHLTYRDRLGLTIPRSTKLLGKTGTSVKRKDLRIGDLVFFKTGLMARHVGIYMGKNRFLHVSSNQGVTITNLDHVYWKKRYWKARRLKSR